MNTSPVQSEMNAQQAAVAAALTQFNYEWIWANGKGGGFWIKGIGYQGLEDCAALINQAIEDFEAVETNRIAEADRAVYEEMQQFRDKPQYLKTLQSTRQSIGNEGIALNDLMQSARFILPALPADPPASRSDLNGMKNRLSKLKREHAAAGDRRDWNGTDQLENQIEALGAEIKRIEAAAQPRQLAELKREIADLEQERQTTTDGAKIARIDQRLGDLYREQTGQRPVTPEPMPGVIGQESLKVLTAAARFHLETLKGNRESAVEYLDNCSVNGDSIAVEGWSQTISHLNEAIAKLEKAITESRM